MANALQDRTILVVGRGSGIARAVTLSARSEGARVVVAGRDRAKLASSYDDDGITAAHLDITDDDSIAALADTVGPLDHVVSTASARARGKLLDLERQNLLESFDTGAWDAMGEEGKKDYFKQIASHNPAGRIGTPADIAAAVLFAMTNTFLTGMTIKVDGGEPLV